MQPPKKWGLPHYVIFGAMFSFPLHLGCIGAATKATPADLLPSDFAGGAPHLGLQSDSAAPGRSARDEGLRGRQPLLAEGRVPEDSLCFF